MKGRINFELKADKIIIHATRWHSKIPFKYFWDTSWWNKQDYIYTKERKDQAIQGNRNGWSPPPPPPPQWKWGMRSEEKLFAKWFEIMPKFREGHCVFPHKRNLYKHAYRDTPTPPPKLCSTLPPPPPRHLKTRLVRRSLTFLGHHTLFMWEDRLKFTAFFSVTAIYLETATTPPP